MKTTHLVIVLIMVTTGIHGSMLTFSVSGEGTNAIYSISGKPYTEDQLTNALSRLHKIGQHQRLHVNCSSETTVSEIVPLLLKIRQAGFTNILLVSPILKDSKKGVQFMDLRLEQLPDSIPSCVGDIHLRDGFMKLRSVMKLDELPPEIETGLPMAADIFSTPDEIDHEDTGQQSP